MFKFTRLKLNIFWVNTIFVIVNLVRIGSQRKKKRQKKENNGEKMKQFLLEL